VDPCLNLKTVGHAYLPWWQDCKASHEYTCLSNPTLCAGGHCAQASRFVHSFGVSRFHIAACGQLLTSWRDRLATARLGSKICWDCRYAERSLAPSSVSSTPATAPPRELSVKTRRQLCGRTGDAPTCVDGERPLQRRPATLSSTTLGPERRTGATAAMRTVDGEVFKPEERTSP